MAEQTRGDGSRAAVMASSPRQPGDLDFDRLSATATGSALLRRFSPRW
jgi:hypothetical protein